MPRVFAPPAVTVRAPVVETEPARLPAVPEAVDCRLEKFGTVPVVIADVGTASACVNDWLKLKPLPRCVLELQQWCLGCKRQN